MIAGLHVIPLHGVDGEFWRMVEELGPAVVKTLELDPAFVRDVHQAAPGAAICLRDQPLSEQHADKDRDPEGTGRRHAEELARQVDRAEAAGVRREKIMATLLNEPDVDWRHAGAIDRLVRYTVAAALRARDLGYTVGALNLGVGWPDQPPGTHGTATPPDWSAFAPALRAIEELGHVLVCHEYWDLAGPRAGWGWWAGRLLKCPSTARKMVLECGIDRHVAQAELRDDKARRGWRWWGPEQGGPDDEGYAAQLWEYAGMMAEAGIEGVTPFTWDGAAEWQMFDVQGEVSALLARKQREARDLAGASLGAVLLAEAERRQGLRLNPGAALQRKILAAGFVPTSEEFDVPRGTHTLRAQRAEDLRTGEVRVYYAVVGQWEHVGYVVRG